MKTYKEATQFESLYESLGKCKRGKMKKASVARFVLHGVKEIIKLERDLENDAYLPRRTKTFRLTYPKARDCSSIHIRDRTVQRSLNDNIIYPAMTKSFILDNMACQKGKGTTAAMDRLTHLMHRFYVNYGTDGMVYQFDIKGYYKSIRHSDAHDCLKRHLDETTLRNIEYWLHYQYPNEIGYTPGSQTVQIIGISILDHLDHRVKNVAKYYMRYMDDGVVIAKTLEELLRCKRIIEESVSELGMELHKKKSRIYHLANGIKILGFTFSLTKSGKVLRIIDPKNVKHERKKLLRMRNLVVKGRRSKKQFYEGYKAWKAHAKLGNTSKVIMRMDKYVKELLKGG